MKDIKFRLEIRTDQVETLKEALRYILDRHDWSLARSVATTSINEIDKMAHRICRARLQEILDQLADTQ